MRSSDPSMRWRSSRSGARRSADPSATPACGLDRVRLERCLLDGARAAGARVAEGATVRDLEPGVRATEFSAAGPTASTRGGPPAVVGADGPSSLVARAFGVARPPGRGRARAHRPSPDLEDARPGGRHPVDPWAPATARLYLGAGPVLRYRPGARRPRQHRRRHERGELRDAWRTARSDGGHRRVSVSCRRRTVGQTRPPIPTSPGGAAPGPSRDHDWWALASCWWATRRDSSTRSVARASIGRW